MNSHLNKQTSPKPGITVCHPWRLLQIFRRHHCAQLRENRTYRIPKHFLLCFVQISIFSKPDVCINTDRKQALMCHGSSLWMLFANKQEKHFALCLQMEGTAPLRLTPHYLERRPSLICCFSPILLPCQINQSRFCLSFMAQGSRLLYCHQQLCTHTEWDEATFLQGT